MYIFKGMLYSRQQDICARGRIVHSYNEYVVYILIYWISAPAINIYYLRLIFIRMKPPNEHRKIDVKWKRSSLIRWQNCYWTLAAIIIRKMLSEFGRRRLKENIILKFCCFLVQSSRINGYWVISDCFHIIYFILKVKHHDLWINN